MIKCAFENGNNAYLRHVTVDALAIKGDRLLLVKRGNAHVEPGKIALPGGYLERDEAGAAAVIRELKEETGFHGTVTTLFRIITKPRTKGDDRQNVALIYLVDVMAQVGESDHEIKSVHWFSLDELPPPEAFAFDHYDVCQLYCQYRRTPHTLPLID